VSEHAELIALASNAASALVAEMTKESWSSIRAAAARIFRHAGDEAQKRQLGRLDADRENVETIDQGELRDRWQRRLITLVEDFPEATNDLAVLAADYRDEQSGNVNQKATGVSGTVIQVGRDNFGGFNTGRK